MAACGERAILIITRPVEGTSTTIAQQRIELTCGLKKDHGGPHRDAGHGEVWDGEPGRISTLLRHEEPESGSGPRGD